ncbi:MAG TPA: hypothetical protein VMZ52_06955 [Bryobacteraceae bacterium]|nr:hypothetical protein [Bryobacteraceae bacterium]
MTRRQIVILLAIAGLGYGQQKSTATSTPIEVANITTTTLRQGPAISFQLTNRSQKKILGYVALLEFTDSAGASTAKTTKMRLRALDSLPGQESFRPGESWTDTSQPVPQDSSGKPLIPKISIDYVLFADHSSWGKDVMRQSLHLQGVMQGWMGARNRYRQILKEKGAQALADDLSNEINDTP